MITASWKRTTLGEICDEVRGVIKTGPFGAQLHESDYVDEGVPVVMPKDIIEGKVRVSTIARIGNEDVERLSQHKLKSGDIVYGRRGDIGRQALISLREQGWLCGTGCLRISLGDKVVDPIFLHYYLSGVGPRSGTFRHQKWHICYAAGTDPNGRGQAALPGCLIQQFQAFLGCEGEVGVFSHRRG